MKTVITTIVFVIVLNLAYASLDVLFNAIQNKYLYDINWKSNAIVSLFIVLIIMFVTLYNKYK